MSIGLNLLAHLLSVADDYFQINTQRYMFDYLPVHIILVALIAQRHKPEVLPALVTYSAALNVLALFVIPRTR